MPTVDDNRQHWENYDWEAGDGGAEWSQAWGGVVPQWYGSILPRLAAVDISGTVLEIAPGFGRWTELLLGHCRELVGVDLAERCVQTCRRRFAGRNARFHRNDGASLIMVADRSVDCVFSFDSLVHVDWDPIQAYLGEIARVLRPGGSAFLHHSNLASVLAGGTEPEQTHWRSREVSAERVARQALDVGLSVVAQEVVNWGGPWGIDAFTWLRKDETPSRREAVENLSFMVEADLARARSALWPLAGGRAMGAGSSSGGWRRLVRRLMAG